MDSTRGLLAHASPELNAVLDRHATTIVLDTGQTLFSVGDTGDALFAVLSGQLEVSVTSEDGRKLVLDIVGADAIVGEIAFFDPGPRTATVEAIEPTRLRRVTNADLMKAVRGSPQLALDLIRLAGRRMRWMNGQLGEQVFLPLPSRLARRLLYLTDPSSPEIRLTQVQLASFVGATREAVSKTLKGWEDQGMIRLKRGGLRIEDRRELAALVQHAPI